MELEQVLRLRRTTRAYTAEPVSQADLERIVQAAQLAPLAAGDNRTTHLTVVSAPDRLEPIRQACMLTSRRTGGKIDAFYGAQAVIFVSATDLSDDSIEYSNAGCVIENMILQATALGLGSTYIWGCLRKLRADAGALAGLALPEGYQVLSALAVGHPVQPLEARTPGENIAVTWLR